MFLKLYLECSQTKNKITIKRQNKDLTSKDNYNWVYSDTNEPFKTTPAVKNQLDKATVHSSIKDSSGMDIYLVVGTGRGGLTS